MRAASGESTATSRASLRCSPVPTWFQKLTTFRSSGLPGSTDRVGPATGGRRATGVCCVFSADGACRSRLVVGDGVLVGCGEAGCVVGFCGAGFGAAEEGGVVAVGGTGVAAGRQAAQPRWVLAATNGAWAWQFGHRVGATAPSSGR